MSHDIFLDTSGWLALLNASEALHADAERAWRELLRSHRSVVLTDWVIAETGNALARRKGSISFGASVSKIMTSRRAEIAFVGLDLLEHALSLYSSRAYKAWGLVDCASFTLMHERGITEAFSSDRHFEQAGFRCLLGVDAVK